MANEINVIELYNAIMQLAKINHAGYASANDFNAQLKATETAFLEAFHDWDEEDQSNTDHLSPFRVHTVITANSDGFVTLPDDYAHLSVIQGVILENPCDGEGEPTRTVEPVIHYRNNEIPDVIVDPIAKPILTDKDTYGLVFRNQGIQLFPKELRGIEITYLRYPVFGEIVFDYSTTPEAGDIFIPDATLSTNLQWKQITFDYFKYAMLFLLGVELKETLLINTAVMNKIINQIKNK